MSDDFTGIDDDMAVRMAKDSAMTDPTDPVERVARADSQVVMDLVDHVAKAIAEHETDVSRGIAAVAAMEAFLNSHNIKIWPLLSGEMVAVPKVPTDEMILAGQGRPHHRPMWTTPTGESILWRWREMCEQAQLDYAGNPPVTPEGRRTVWNPTYPADDTTCE